MPIADVDVLKAFLASWIVWQQDREQAASSSTTEEYLFPTPAPRRPQGGVYRIPPGTCTSRPGCPPRTQRPTGRLTS